MPSHSEHSSSDALDLPSESPAFHQNPSASFPLGSTIEPPSSPTMTSSSSSSSSPMGSSPILAPSSPIEPPDLLDLPTSTSSGTIQAQQERILILGATGNQGRGTVHALLSSKLLHLANFHLAALVRNPTSAASLSLTSSSSQSGAGIPPIPLFVADYSSPATLSAAFAAFLPTTVFFPPILSDDFALDLTYAQNVISAARQCGSVRSFIVSTALGTDRRSEFKGWGKNGEWYPMGSYWRAKGEIEKRVKEAGFASWTIIRPGWFLHCLVPQRMCGWSYLGFRETDEVKTIRTSWRKATKVAWVDAEDVGVVVRAVVEDLCEGGGKSYRNRGVDLAVEAVTVGELARKMARVLGEEVKVLYAEEQQTLITGNLDGTGLVRDKIDETIQPLK
ncbi:NAD(P)-binding protein [Neurospora crassa]|uniref:NmrA-like domain-containing protein n=1 Tax=Neurospora crassa (strain ATCC 24698 / 74-OR23-1A / CBS 708.71 / DSM 1257 / FGSC 987) TaxID=367110 RepID=Q7S011_NEUCR|nr:hypothetical protein NCU09430 [Neurospora crassa OR74A]EAA28622.1 hypothetical protein NCU09430 [Neurospora crassa OR74A]KHE87242.1 NAD(P)-binding protein [Neurospora crassa]|eukprot:XP_957858.1 hypothetical protein NCU09430 [Neurospora crassa OR74A]